MAEERAQRRLAAILAADVVGYSRLMGVSEAGTLAALKAHRRELIDGTIAEHQGRIVKLTGDGMLVEFPSVVNAVACAAEIQRKMAKRNADVPQDQRIEFRIGVHLGDIIFEDNDIFGDGVNIAARIESIAKPGGVCVSGSVRDNVGNRLDLAYEDMGEQTLKNIDRPVRVYEISLGAAFLRAARAPQATAADKSSIAILPFINMSGDPEQQYFSDGITEDIITELSRFRSLTVIARHSSFALRDRPLDVAEIAQKLGVECIVEGSVRRAGNRARITARLIDVESGSQLWSEHYDRDLTDIFTVQDEIVHAIVAALPGRIDAAGMRLARRKRPENLTAYDCFLRGLEFYSTMDRAAEPSARHWFERAIAADPNLAVAYSYISALHLRNWYLELSAQDLEQALVLARRAADLDPNDGHIQGGLGVMRLYCKEFDEAAFRLKRALALNPNDTLVMVWMGWLATYRGRPAEGLDWMSKAASLNPYPPPWFNTTQAMVLYGLHRYKEAAAILARETNPSAWVQAYLLATYGHMGRLDEARASEAKFREQCPDRSLLQVAAIEPYESTVDLDHLLDGLRKAGVSY